MTPEQKAAFVNSQVACALIEAMGMQAENQQRTNRGHSIAYGEDAFAALIEKYGIHHNAVHSYTHM
jgi:hypothetical protein